MKILLYSFSAYPAVGGVETITHTLATNLVKCGVQCTVVTETPGDSKQTSNYHVVRCPSVRDRFKLVRQHDLVHSNGASMRMFVYAKVAGRPFIWTHNGYQLSCIDGLGCREGDLTPLTPKDSIAYYAKQCGFFYASREAAKLYLRRCVGRCVDLNIAATQWVAKRQPLPKQAVAYTPYALDAFKTESCESKYEYDFIYVGRLVSEKGVETLLEAIALLVRDPKYLGIRLAIVGNGPLRGRLEKMAAELQIEKQCVFLGSKRGSELVEIIRKSKIGVVPSRYEEPMGGVALELLASRKNLIVSERGGHAECAGQAALTFENGNPMALYEQMVKLLNNPELAREQLERAKERVVLFDEVLLTKKYIDLYQEVLK